MPYKDGMVLGGGSKNVTFRRCTCWIPTATIGLFQNQSRPPILAFRRKSRDSDSHIIHGTGIFTYMNGCFLWENMVM